MKLQKKIISTISTIFVVLSFQNAVKAENITPKSDLKYLETKVLYSKKPIVRENWYDYKRGLFLADKQNKYIFMSFCLDDNSYCNKLEAKTYNDPRIKKILREKFIKVKIDPKSENRISANKNMLEKDLTKEYEIEGYPTIAFLNPQGKLVSGSVKGFVDSNKLLVILNYISSEAYKTKKLNNF